MLRHGVETGPADIEGVAVVADELPGPETPDELHGFFEDRGPAVVLGPRVAQDVLVQVLAGPDPEPEAAGQHVGAVAAAWARIAGWIRRLSAVTPVPIGMRSVTAAIPPMTDHTNGLWP